MEYIFGFFYTNFKNIHKKENSHIPKLFSFALTYTATCCLCRFQSRTQCLLILECLEIQVHTSMRFIQRIRAWDVIRFFKLGPSHESYCQVKGQFVLIYFLIKQHRRIKTNDTFLFRSRRYVGETCFSRSGCLREMAMKTEGRKLQRKFAFEMFTWGHSGSQFEKRLVLNGGLPEYYL